MVGLFLNHINWKVIKMIRILIVCFLVVGCVSNKAVKIVDMDDYEMNCKQLKFELTNLGAEFDEAKGDSGLTGKNIGLGLFSGLES